MKLTLPRVAASAFAIAGLAAGIATAIPSAASAQPFRPSCASSINTGYLGAQQAGTGQWLSQGIFGTVVAARRGSADSICQEWFAYDGGQNKVAEQTSGGVPNGQVMTQVGSRLVFTRGVKGNTHQQWLAIGDPSDPTKAQWQNQGSDQIIQVQPNGSVRMVSSSTAPAPSNEFTFIGG